MEHSTETTWVKRAAPGIDRERRLVREAIAMVAIGASPRVVVASLKHSQALLESASRQALESGVRIRALWRTDGAGADLAVEPIE